MSSSILDYIGEIQISQSTDWIKLTNNVKKLFVEQSPMRNRTDFDKTDTGMDNTHCIARLVADLSISTYICMEIALWKS